MVASTDREQILDMWIEALESGRYPQGIGVLRGKKGYCCLGVLCDLINPNAWQRGTNDIAAIEWFWGEDQDQPQVLLPPISVHKRLNISSQTMQDLSNINDTEAVEFKTIARMVRHLKEKQSCKKFSLNWTKDNKIDPISWQCDTCGYKESIKKKGQDPEKPLA